MRRIKKASSNPEDYGGGRNTLGGTSADVHTFVKDKEKTKERQTLRAQQREINHHFKETLRNIQECNSDAAET